MNPSNSGITTSTTTITSVAECIRCMFRTIVEIVVIARHNRDVQTERLFLRHNTYNSNNIIDDDDQYHYTSTGGVADSHAIFEVRTTTTGVHHDVIQEQQRRSLLIHHYLRVLNHDGANNITNESIYVSNETEKGSFTAGSIVSILLCLLIVVLFIWLGYCACWFSYGG